MTPDNVVLSVMRSKVAMDRCYEFYKAKPDSEDAIRAGFLLASFADDAALPWVRHFSMIGIKASALVFSSAPLSCKQSTLRLAFEPTYLPLKS